MSFLYIHKYVYKHHCYCFIVSKKAAFTDPVVVIKSKNEKQKRNLDFSFENLYAERCKQEQKKREKLRIEKEVLAI